MMPLLKGITYQPSGQPEDLKRDEEVFLIKNTGEILRDYEEYVQKVRLYRTPQWTCAYSGKSGLTYEQAIKEEAKILKTIPQVRCH